jgi:hypothetical protein
VFEVMRCGSSSNARSPELRYIKLAIECEYTLPAMLARFDLFRSYARLCEERSRAASDIRTMVEWAEAAVQWQTLANTAAVQDRDKPAAQAPFVSSTSW